jgi:hypothetical protein
VSRAATKREWPVVIGWGAGMYRFHTRWEAALFRWIARRWSGWTHWDYLTDDERARSLKPRRRFSWDRFWIDHPRLGFGTLLGFAALWGALITLGVTRGW